MFLSMSLWITFRWRAVTIPSFVELCTSRWYLTSKRCIPVSGTKLVQMANRKPCFWGRIRRCFGTTRKQGIEESKHEFRVGTVSIEDAERDIQMRKRADGSIGRHHKPADSDKEHSRTNIEQTSKHRKRPFNEKEPRKNRETKKSNAGRKTASGNAKKSKELNKPVKPRPAGIDTQFIKILTDSQTAVHKLQTQLSVFATETITAMSLNIHAMHQGFCDLSWIATSCTHKRK